jgi:phospholipase D1/2
MAQSPIAPPVQVTRTVHQICTTDGTPYQGYATANIWVSYADPYPKTDGNAVTPILSGEEYFRKLAEAIAKAEKTVYMLGWQINWDVMLTPGLRLYDALLAAAKARPALKIYVLPWAAASVAHTFDQQTVAVVNAINVLLGGAPRVFAVRASEHSNPDKGLAAFFSHHQKQVVIDERIAFMGGLDVAYGRRDDATYSLNATGRLGNDAYNGCVPHLLPVKAEDYVEGEFVGRPESIPTRGGQISNPDVAAAKRNLSGGKVEMPTDGAGNACLLDAARQPRMPWQDVELQIEGPAVSDLTSNFVLRWNVAARDAETFGMGGPPLLPLPPKPDSYPMPGSCSVQLLRSASTKMVELEAKSVTAEERPRVHNKFGHNHIHQAMVRLIENADHFIYIENQFFTSAFGVERFGDGNTVEHPPKSDPVESAVGWTRQPSRLIPGSGDADAPPQNLICAALGAKLRNVILDVGNPPPDGKTSAFHVYITLPVHSEGMLNDFSTMTQVHYSMQSLVYGSQSLLNQVRRAILARQLLAKEDKGYHRVFADLSREYEAVPIEACWPYVTLLNLRTWEKLGDRYVTEQVYVHTKMMVVDDRFAIVGSANINDRSLLGSRDSEMAVLVMDTNYSYEDIGSPDGPTVVRGFARNLRMDVWKKIFGITGGVRPATELKTAIEKPAGHESWEAIRSVAEANTDRYQSAFRFIPGNRASIWPTIGFNDGKRNVDAAGNKVGLMPFDNEFWDRPQHQPQASNKLPQVGGYITLLPWLWTFGENNNSGYHSALFTENDAQFPPEAAPSAKQARNNDGLDTGAKA